MLHETSRAALSIGLILVSALIGAAARLPAAEEDAGLPGLDGGRLTQADLAEGHTIIVVWASWSPRSRTIGPRLDALAERWGKRARVISVNFQEGEEKARAFARKQRFTVPVYLDREAVFAKRYAVTSLPFLLVVSDGETAFAGKFPLDPDVAIRRALG